MHIQVYSITQTQDKQSVFLRKAQSSRDGSLYMNLPSEWTTIVDMKKSDTLKCSIIHSIVDNDFYLEVHKVQEML
jgi:hypothetical protein